MYVILQTIYAYYNCFAFGSNVSKNIANIKSSQSPNYNPAMLLKK